MSVLKGFVVFLVLLVLCPLTGLHADTPDNLRPSGGALVPAETLGGLNSIAGNDDYVVIGNFWATVEGIPDLGGVIVMAPDETGQWVEESWVPGTEAGLSESAVFGREVAVDGDRFFVGARGVDFSYSQPNSGAVFEFRRDPVSGAVEYLREIPRPEEDAQFFGVGVAAEGEWLAVGASFGEQLPDEEYGATYLFRWSDAINDWEYVQKLLAPDREDGGHRDEFGTEVRMAYPWLAVAARNAWVADQADRLGAIYLYRHDAASDEWRFEQKLVGDPPEGDRQPGKVRLVYMDEGHVLMSGNDKKSDGTSSQYRLYVFELNETGDTWDKTALMETKNPDNRENSAFGFGGAIVRDGERLVVTNAFEARPSGEHDGALYIYERDASAPQGWALMGSLRPPWRSWGTGHSLANAVAPAGPEGLAALASGTGSLGHARGTVFVFQPEAEPVRLSVSDAWVEGGSEPVSGREFGYHWRVDNAGPATATNVHLRLDASSADFALEGAGEPCWWDSSADVHVCLIKTIPPGGHATVRLDMVAEEAGDYAIDSLVVSDQLDETPDGRADSFNLTVAEPGSGSSSGCSLGRGPYELLGLLLLALALRGFRRHP